ncbi:ATP-binding protein [Dyella sp. 2HG41-7]|uniref:sensor histidine kinase n=1 Tax=Dyella sp. 2HG41-7 TaxID=2883239 RepID=UPI001F19EB39|nr:ATP-binding protein [Dyella sp. 2HG41-7]
MRKWFALWLVCAWFACPASAQQTLASNTATIDIQTADAAPADWPSQTPPVDGWTPVTLIDFWDTRWPHHNGVVWYRLRWNQASADKPVGLLIDYINSAYALYLNGSLVYSDTHLTEPLSRSWSRPHYFLADRPLLRAGQNELLVRVSGFSSYQPGLGVVSVGNPVLIQERQRRGEFHRYDTKWFDQSVGLVFGGLFFILWLMRRQDSYYGWYALSNLFSALYGINDVVSSPWPFDSTDAWQAIIAATWAVSAVTFSIFLLRYAGKRWKRIERCMLLLCVALLGVALLFPHQAGPYRNIDFLIGACTYYVSILGFIGYALRHRRADNVALAASLLIPIIVSVHDLLLLFNIFHSDIYLLSDTSSLTIIGMGVALAYRFAAAMRRAENYTVELQHEVDAATQTLSETLKREHDLAINNVRIGERLNLVRDLHDGFGGSLLSAISTLEDPRRPPEAGQVVATLKELRDDLRLIIDTTTHEQDNDLAALIAPLRHRWSQRFEAIDIEDRWAMEGVDGLNLGTARALELLRFLQEALTNVFKHSRASQVLVRIRRDGDTLSVEVRDDGQGFDASYTKTHGAGLPSLRARATRLGATLSVTSSPGTGAYLSFAAPLSPIA